MKVLFANPPVIRSASSSPGNDFKINGFVFKPFYRRIPGVVWILRSLGVGAGIRYGVRAGSRWPWSMDFPHGGPPYPFIMGYAAALLRDRGYAVNIVDAVAEEEYSYARFLNIVKAENADVVVLECSTPTLDIDLWVSRKISAFTEVALAGPHVAADAEKLQFENPHIKYLLKGEYIHSALKMASDRRPGIYESEVVRDLDSIPFPFRDYPSTVKYYDPTMPTERPQLQIYASKGCPFHCTFCPWPRTMYKGTVSQRKPEAVAEEIRTCVERFKFRSIFFDDDTFNIGNERIGRLCDELRKIGLPWTMMGRLDCSPAWLYDKMVDSGCVGMRFGIETFSDEVLRTVRKDLQSDKIIQTLTHITQKNPRLMIHLTMMKDLPGQTESIHQKDLKILRDLGYTPQDMRRSYQLSACVPFPGTELYDSLARSMPAERLENFKLYDGALDTIMTPIK